jgi:amino acid carrier protein
MWMVALVGMATAYAESTLAQLYKVRNDEGQYRGGPAFYIARGLGQRWAGGVFSVCLILAFGLVFNAVQANSIADAMEGAFGLPKIATGVFVAALAGIVIFGGIRSIARVAGVIVPFMAIAYLLMALWVMVANIGELPGVLWLIVGSAFGLTEAAAGFAGGMAAAMLNGVKRGLFSNEAGMGSAPNIAAVATPDPHHPSSQGFVQALGVFIDTILICTATAFMILLSGLLDPTSGLTGTQLTQSALEVHIGSFGAAFIAIAILFFAFTSIIGNYSYSENAMTFLGVGTGVPIMLLRAIVLVMVLWGSLQSGDRIQRRRRLNGPDGDDQPDRDRDAVGYGGKAHQGLFRAEEGRPRTGLRGGGVSRARREDRPSHLVARERLRASSAGRRVTRRRAAPLAFPSRWADMSRRGSRAAHDADFDGVLATCAGAGFGSDRHYGCRPRSVDERRRPVRHRMGRHHRAVTADRRDAICSGRHQSRPPAFHRQPAHPDGRPDRRHPQCGVARASSDRRRHALAARPRRQRLLLPDDVGQHDRAAQRR